MSQNQQKQQTRQTDDDVLLYALKHLTTLLKGRLKYFGLYLVLCLVQEGYDIGYGVCHSLFPTSEYFSGILANSSGIKLYSFKYHCFSILGITIKYDIYI